MKIVACLILVTGFVVLAQNVNYVSASGGDLAPFFKSDLLALFAPNGDANLIPAVTRTWDGGGATNNWSEAANWSDDVVPGPGDTVAFDGTSTKNAVIDVNVSIDGFNINTGYTGTISQGTSSIILNQAFTQADGIFSGGSGPLDFNGTFTVSGGAFTASSGNTSWARNFTISNAGSFDANGGTAVFNEFSSTVDVVNLVEFADLEINKNFSTNSLTVAAGDTVRVNGNLVLSNGLLNGTGTLETLGGLTISPNFPGGTGRLGIGGNAARTITIPAPIFLPNVIINAPNADVDTIGTGEIVFNSLNVQNVNSLTNNTAVFTITGPFSQSGGNVTSVFSVFFDNTFTQTGGNFSNGSFCRILGNMTLSGGTFTDSPANNPVGNLNIRANLTVNGGNFIANGGKVDFTANTVFTVAPSGSVDFNNVELNSPNGLFPNTDSTLRVNGTLTLTNGFISSVSSLSNGTIEALGNVNIANTFDGGDGILLIGGNAARTITIPSPVPMSRLTVNAPNTTINTSGTGTITFRRTDIQSVASMTNGAADFNFLSLGTAAPFTISGGTFDVGSGSVQINPNFTQTGGTFNGNSSNIDINGIFTLSGGTFTASSGTTSFASNFFVSSPGVFDANGGSVVFDGLSTTFDVTPNGVVEFNNVELNTSVINITANDTLRVGGNLILTSGQMSGTGTLEALDGVSINTGYTGGGGNLLIGGNAARTITIQSPTALPNLTVNAPNVDINTSGNGIVDFNSRTIVQNVNSMTNDAATFAFSGTDQYEQSGGTFNVGSGNITFGSLFTQSGGTFTGSSSTLQFNNIFTVSGGTFTASSGNTNFIQNFNISGTGVFEHNNGTARFVSSSGTVNVVNSQDFNNVEIDKSNGFTALGLGSDDVMRIRGNLLLTNGQISTSFGNARFEAFGDVTISPTFAGGSGNLHYVGTNDQTYTNNGGNNPSSIMRIDKPSGILTAATDLILPTNTGLVINSGTLYLADGSDLTAGGAVTGVSILANGRLVSDSATTITLGGNVSNGGIVDLRGGGTCPASDTILIRSTNGTQRSWTGLGTYRLVNVDVQSMGGTGTKSVYNGTDSGGNNASWVFDPGCPGDLTLSPLTASVQTGATQTFTASGGFSPYTFSFVTNNSGGSINASSGLYTAGTTAGVTDTVRVTDAFGDSTDATANTFGEATNLAITAQPTNTTAGQTISAVQVAVRDQFGNPVTNSTASITLSIANNPNSGTLSGTVTKNAVNGIAVFNDLSINRAGAGYTLQAAAGGLNPATSSAFDISAGAPTRLAFTIQPSDADLGAAIAPPVQVAVEDNIGNTVTTATNQITIAIGTNPGSGTLSGTLTRSAAGGIAVFDDLSIDAFGTGYTLTASSGALTSAVSGAFNIGSPFEVTNTNDVGSGSLRQVILNSNATPGKQTITFNISGTAPFLIAPLTPLPEITDPVTIDARSQPGFTAAPIVVIRGTNLASNACGLTARSTNSVDIYGFVFGNLGCGIRGIVTNEMSIKGNYFGLNAAGTGIDAISGRAIDINAGDNNLIGGSTAADRNVIAGTQTGIFLDGSSENNRIIGNYIGTNANGTARIQTGVGVLLEGNQNLIGSAAPGEGNVISGNGTGVGIRSTGNQVLGNLIGTAADGVSPLGNNIAVSVVNRDNVIGGIAPGEGNTIAFSFYGFLGLAPMTNTPVRGNSFHSNSTPGIFGVNTQNDPQDSDTGPNQRQNTPVIVSAGSAAGATTVRGTLNSAPAQNFELDFYSNPVCQPNLEQGRTYLGTVSATTDGGGLTGFIANLPAVPVGQFITATATDADGNTSVFAKCAVVAPGPFSITGRITDAGGNPIPNSLVRVDGFRTAFNADSNGNYAIRNLPGGRDYIIRPSAGGATFNPASRTVTNLLADESGQDFGAVDPDLSISGQVTGTNNGSDFPIVNATVQLLGTTAGTVQTDANGRYSFNALTSGGNYQVQVSAPNFNFPTPTRSFTNLTIDQTADFAGSITPHPVGRVVFATGRKVFTMNADGTAKTEIVNLGVPGSCHSASFSNDGSQIVFACDFDSGNGIFTARFDGSDLAQISTERGNSPRFSPDGARIAFVRDQLIRVMNSDGSGAATLFNTDGNGGGFVHHLDWSPDGSKIVLSKTSTGSIRQDLFTLNSDGTNLTPIAIGGQGFAPRYSPDGSQIAFLFSPLTPTFARSGQVALINANGTGFSLTSSPATTSKVDWAPDGSFLSYTLPSGGAYGVMETDGTNQRTLSFGVPEHDLGPGFAPTTPTGTSVTTTAGAVDVTFNGVSTGGQTTAVPIPPNSAGTAPSGFVLGTQAYEISTTAAFTPAITVCFAVQGAPTQTQFDQMSILHNEGGVLVDRTVSRNFATKQICASVLSLSPFVLAEQIDSNLPSITGLILDNNGVPMSGVSVNLTGAELRQTQTDPDGSFKFVNLTANGNYNISPKQVGYLFDEYNTNVIGLTGEETVFFAGTANDFGISGKVTDGLGTGVAGVSVELDGSSPAIATTDADGNYAFTGLPADGFYVVTPITTGNPFSPDSAKVGALTSDLLAVDFVILAPTAANSAISGKVVNAKGAGIAGVRVSVTGTDGQVRQALTNSFGRYRFENLPVGNIYVLTVSSRRWRFANSNQVINLDGDLTVDDIIAEPF